MLKIKNYVKAESLEQAYELNQKCLYERCHPGKRAAHCRRAVSKLCHSGGEYFRKIRIFRCADHVSGTGYLGGAVQWRNHSAGTVCIHGKR